MSSIQVIQYKLDDNLRGKGIKLSKFENPVSLDEFDINIIDLSHPQMWINHENSINDINCSTDLENINTMIQYSKKCRIVFILPQNLDYYCNYGSVTSYSSDFRTIVELKNYISDVEESILQRIFMFPFLGLKFENTTTKMNGINYTSNFWFSSSLDPLTLSLKSSKCTTVQFFDNYVATTLLISNYDNLIGFLDGIGLIKIKDDQPDWIKSLEMFNDINLKDDIQNYEIEIESILEKIDECNSKIEENNRWKSILYTNGDELVEVVFEILERLLEVNLDDFVDVKKEDFHINIKDTDIIGEIKGVSTNLKSEHVSQVDVHLQGYLDALASPESSNAKSLLIINHQRKKTLNSREDIHVIQAKLANRNDCLVIETKTLLNLYECYLKEYITSDEIADKLINETGVMQFDIDAV